MSSPSDGGKEHITNGAVCWCNPHIDGNVVIHNKQDNWKQYAKEGETAQDVIERTRADLDSFIKLYLLNTLDELGRRKI